MCEREREKRDREEGKGREKKSIPLLIYETPRIIYFVEIFESNGDNNKDTINVRVILSLQVSFREIDPGNCKLLLSVQNVMILRRTCYTDSTNSGNDFVPKDY